jgi:tetratricopeptide (TPR) repeat protein
MCYYNRGRLLLSQQIREAAEADDRKALDIFEKLAKDFPSVPEYRQHVATSHEGLAVALEKLGDLPNAEAAFRQSLAIREKLAKDFPTPNYRQELAFGYCRLANFMHRQKKWEEAGTNFRAAVSVLKPLAQEFSGGPHYRADLAGNRGRLAEVLAKTGKRTEAAAEYGLAIESLKQLTREYPEASEYGLELGGNQCNLGVLHDLEGRSTGALNWYGQAIQTLTTLVKRNPRLPSARQYLVNSHTNRARVLWDLGRVKEALSDWDRGIEYDDGASRTHHQMWRAECRASIAPDIAVAEAEEILRDRTIPSTFIYLAARVYAQSSATAKGAAKCERYAARAVALLEQARGSGHFRHKCNFEEFKTDTGFDPLRQREDFRKLVAELKSK